MGLTNVFICFESRFFSEHVCSELQEQEAFFFALANLFDLKVRIMRGGLVPSSAFNDSKMANPSFRAENRTGRVWIDRYALWG